MRISFGMLMEIRNVVWDQRKWGFQEEKLEHTYFKRIRGMTEQHGLSVVEDGRAKQRKKQQGGVTLKAF